jgi:hypothetical protein
MEGLQHAWLMSLAGMLPAAPETLLTALTDTVP